MSPFAQFSEVVESLICFSHIRTHSAILTVFVLVHQICAEKCTTCCSEAEQHTLSPFAQLCEVVESLILCNYAYLDPLYYTEYFGLVYLVSAEKGTTYYDTIQELKTQFAQCFWSCTPSIC